jgi:hypothetical protein
MDKRGIGIVILSVWTLVAGAAAEDDPFETATKVEVVDSKGNFIGIAGLPETNGHVFVALKAKTNKQIFRVRMSRFEVYADYSLYYEKKDCTGPAYIALNPWDRDDMLVLGAAFGPPGKTVYVPVMDASEYDGHVRSTYNAVTRKCEDLASEESEEGGSTASEESEESDSTPFVPTVEVGNWETYFKPPYRLVTVRE